MNPVIIMALALLVFVVVWRIKNRTQRKRSRVPAYSPRVEGFQVTAFVHPRMSGACLFDHGVQHGKGFRRKEGPQLPHDESCRCGSIPFSFTSSEVFNGALRHVGGISGTIPDFAEDEFHRLVEALKQVEGRPLLQSEAAYVAAVNPQNFPARTRTALAEFLAERSAYLAAGGAQPQSSSAEEAAESSQSGRTADSV
jgi:hypothetical protein